MTTDQRRPLIVTDLDGTLLDHFDYRFDPARPVLRCLAEQGVPVVINTSKTRSEVEVLRRRLRNRDPFVVENGSAIFLPKAQFSAPQQGAADAGDYWVHRLGADILHIRRVLAGLRDEFRFTSFGDWRPDELMAHAGLDRPAAQRALEREFSEPLLWQDSDIARARFCRRIEAEGLHTLQGGRYLHVLGAADKGHAVLRLRRWYEAAWGKDCCLIALGDSDNDRAMLEVADIPVVVRSPVHGAPTLSEAVTPVFTTALGPEGWAQVVAQLLPRFGLKAP